jgi:hypothetical protein
MKRILLHVTIIIEGMSKQEGAVIIRMLSIG